jgi:hypothetical protein
MNKAEAFTLATGIVKTFIESQEIPPGGTTGTAKDHGEKTAQFLTAMHRTLYDYFVGFSRGSGSDNDADAT